VIALAVPSRAIRDESGHQSDSGLVGYSADSEPNVAQDGV